MLILHNSVPHPKALDPAPPSWPTLKSTLGVSCLSFPKIFCLSLPWGSVVKNPPAVQEQQEMRVWFLGREDPLEESMATYSSILAWRSPWTEEPGGLQSIGSTKSWIWQKTLESPLDCKEIQPVHSKGDQLWVFFGRNDAKAETPVLWPPHAKSWLIGKDSDAGRNWGQEEKGITEDEMAGWHHQLDGHELEWTPGVGDGQGGLACYDSWGRKELDTTERLNETELKWLSMHARPFAYTYHSLVILYFNCILTTFPHLFPHHLSPYTRLEAYRRQNFFKFLVLLSFTICNIIDSLYKFASE